MSRTSKGRIRPRGPLASSGGRVRARSTPSGDEGAVLVAVLGAITVLTLLALVALSAAISAAPLSRKAQDARAATAAAQAGVDDYLARLVADPGYYTTSGTGLDANNPAFTSGVATPGGSGTSFSYRLLTTPSQTAQDGVIRLRVTGRSRTVQRSLTASLSQTGFLDYVYFTDLEVIDPALVDIPGVPAYVSNGSTISPAPSGQQWSPDPSVYAQKCGSYYFAGRHSLSYQGVSFSQYVSSPSTPYIVKNTTTGSSAPSLDYGRTIYFACSPIYFGNNDVLTGPVHTNDAIAITGAGAVTFTSPVTETGWADGTSPAPNPNARYYGDGSPRTSGGYAPVYAPVLQLPGSNGDLKVRIQSEGRSAGCTYTGQTTIRYTGTTMSVLSPQTTTSTPGCFDASRRTEEQSWPTPPLVYVDDLAGSCPSPSTSVGYPRPGEVAKGQTRINYDCSYGTAFVQGSVSGQTTLATARDVVVTGDLTYAGGVTGTDVLGLIPNGFAWIYNPQTSTDSRLLSTPVRRVDAGIMSVGHSFVVQNYDRGGPLGTLTVRGTIAQKHRGVVKQGNNGYVKDYIFDRRLANLPPPFFLSPADSPWTVARVTDG